MSECLIYRGQLLMVCNAIIWTLLLINGFCSLNAVTATLYRASRNAALLKAEIGNFCIAKDAQIEISKRDHENCAIDDCDVCDHLKTHKCGDDNYIQSSDKTATFGGK